MPTTTLRLVSLALALIGAAAIASDTAPSAAPERTAASLGKDTATGNKAARAQCVNQCTAKDAKCGSDVRRARQECSRNAANAGRDPMTMRRNDYGYFCGHFLNPAVQCGAGYYASGCIARYEHRYALCIDDMSYNIAALRYDCFKAERDATRMCRAELQDCRRACEQG